MMHPYGGLFISFEGLEASGKSTQIQRLGEYLKEKGVKVHRLREPGGTPIGEEIRHILKHTDSPPALTVEAELLLMNASRAQLVHEVIRPALASGESVVCDRFCDSTSAYQGYGRRLDMTRVNQMIEFATGGLKPDLTFLIDISLEQSVKNMGARGSLDRFEKEAEDFFTRVNTGYRILASAERTRFRVIPYIHTKSDEMFKYIQRAVDAYVAQRG